MYLQIYANCFQPMLCNLLPNKINKTNQQLHPYLELIMIFSVTTIITQKKRCKFIDEPLTKARRQTRRFSAVTILDDLFSNFFVNYFYLRIDLWQAFVDLKRVRPHKSSILCNDLAIDIRSWKKEYQNFKFQRNFRTKKFSGRLCIKNYSINSI